MPGSLGVAVTFDPFEVGPQPLCAVLETPRTEHIFYFFIKLLPVISAGIFKFGSGIMSKIENL
jgi:hypothetical protein